MIVPEYEKVKRKCEMLTMIENEHFFDRRV